LSSESEKTNATVDLGAIGVWSPGLRLGDRGEIREAAAELEELGYGAAWIPGAANAGTVNDLAPLLDATTSLVAAAGVVNIWVERADEVAASAARIEERHPGRTLIGLGISHAPLIGARYVKPFAALEGFLDELDRVTPGLPADRRLLGAIGPRTLELASRRALGSHPYLMPPEHTAAARERLGPNALLAPEQTVIFEPDPVAARAAAREFLGVYLQLPNYMRNLRDAAALDDADFADGGSDRLIDAAVAWGDEEAIRRRVHAHLDAGADHVCIQVAPAAHDELPRAAWRRLAPALVSDRRRTR
jgi:probable F420-dependent oxidoreductase